MNNNLASKVSNFLIKIRKQNNLTQQELANLVGLSRNFISDIELEKKSISLDSLEKILNTLNIDISEIFCNKEKLENDK